MKRFLLPGALVVLVLAYPLLTAGSPVYQRLGASPASSEDFAFLIDEMGPADGEG